MSQPSFIPLSVPDLRGREAEYLAQCVADNWVSSAGPFVTDLERSMSMLCNVEYGVAVASGSAALHLSLLVAGVSPGDHVIVPDWTFAATANAVLHCGAIPLFVDIDDKSWCLDPKQVEKILADPNFNIRAVIGVDTLGHPADWDALSDVCSPYNIPLIEDAAGSIGALYKGRPTGSLADIAIFSFNGNKLITGGGGGIIVTNNAEWANKARHLSTQARVGDEYEHDMLGFNYRLTNINAAVALAQLERLEVMLLARRNIASRYDDALVSHKTIELMPRCDWSQSSCWLYSIALQNEKMATELLGYLASRNIGARRFWISLSSQAPYKDAPQLVNTVSRELSGRVISLPCSSSLDMSSQDRVIEAMLTWLAQ